MNEHGLWEHRFASRSNSHTVQLFLRSIPGISKENRVCVCVLAHAYSKCRICTGDINTEQVLSSQKALPLRRPLELHTVIICQLVQIALTIGNMRLRVSKARQPMLTISDSISTRKAALLG